MAKIKYTGEEALGRVADYVNKKLTIADSMPDSPDTDTIILYVGVNDDPYIQGGIYYYDGTDWNLINSVKTIELTKDEYDDLPAAVQNNGTIYFVTDMEINVNVVEGYYNPDYGAFYADDQYTIEIPGARDKIYTSLDTNLTYRYNIDDDDYTEVGGNHRNYIEYVNRIPSSGIENKVYGMASYKEFFGVFTEEFMSNPNYFDVSVELDGTHYTPKDVFEMSFSGSVYYRLVEIIHADGSSDWNIYFEDAVDPVVKTTGDDFYFRIVTYVYYMGDETRQMITEVVTRDNPIGQLIINPAPALQQTINMWLVDTGD